MGYFQRALSRIEEGRQGLNKGIPIPFEKLNTFIPNIQQRTYYLVIAGTKVGKTTLTDDIFFYSAYDYYKNKKDTNTLEDFDLEIDYFSFEIDVESKIIKGITRKLFHDYGININADIILSKGKNYCEQELYDLIKKYEKYFQDLEEVCTIHEMPDNPTGIHKHLYRRAEANGQIITQNINKDPNGVPVMRFKEYIPNNKKKFRLAFLDHVALMAEERGFNTKQNIDKMSQMFVMHRNNFNLTPIVVQQLNFDTDNDERHKSNRLTPTLRDIGDSKYTARDANIIMALFNPSAFGLEKFQGYNITKLGNTFRNLEILVNRDGEPNVNLGLNFIGAAGTFRELPSPSLMNDIYYERAYNCINLKSKYVQNNEGIWIENSVLNNPYSN